MQVISFAGVFITILIAITGTIAFFTSRLKQSTEDIIRTQNEDLRKSVGDLIIRLTDTEQREEECKERLTKLEVDHNVLVRVIAGNTTVETLTLKLEALEKSLKIFIEDKLK